MSCENARELTHRVLDGELMDAGLRQQHDEHLERCPLCREHREELRELQSVLRALPAVPLAEVALEEVFEQTVRAPRPERTRRRPGWAAWGVAAAAAVIVTLAFLGGSGLLERSAEQTYSEAEMDRAAAEARLALNLTARALRTGERQVIQGVRGAVAPALQRVPLRLPEKPAGQQEKSDNEV